MMISNIITIFLLLTINCFSGVDTHKLYTECEGNISSSCLKIAHYYHTGAEKIGIKQDIGKAISIYKAECNKKIYQACHSLSVLYYIGWGKTFDRSSKKALYYESLACRYGGIDSCYALAKLYYEGTRFVNKNSKKSINYLTKACQLKLYKSCYIAAMLYHADDTWFDKNKTSQEYTVDEYDFTINKNDAIEQNITKAIQYYDKACDGSISASCISLANIYLEDTNNTSRALKYLKKSCGLEDSKGCLALGLVYYQGRRHVKKDYGKASEYFLKACKFQNNKGCNLYGMMLFLGEGTNVNINRSIKYFKKSCNSGSMEGCNLSAESYYKIGDCDNAYKYAKRACDNNFSIGCYNIANLYLYQKCFKLNYKKVFKFYKKSSDLGFESGTYKVGLMYYFGQGVKKNINRALGILKKTCLSGHLKSCIDFVSLASRKKHKDQKAYSKIQTILSEGCDNNTSKACNNLAAIYLENNHIQKAINLYKKACDLGMKQACKPYNYLLKIKNKDSHTAIDNSKGK